MSSSWQVVKLGTLLTDIQPGFASGTHNSEGTGIPHFRPMNVSTEGRIERRVMKFVDPSAGQPGKRLRRGDVLFNNTNSPELVGKTALFDGDDSPAFSNHMTRLRVDESKADGRFVAMRLHQAWREGWFAAHCNNHVSQASIGRDLLRDFEVDLPPISIQREIASLGTTVDDTSSSASAHLIAARRAVSSFRQAVLAAACAGRLTSDWRADHPNDRPSPVTPVAKRRRRADVDVPVDLQLPELPDLYEVTTIGGASVLLEYGTSTKAEPDGDGVPVLRMGNIQDGVLDLRELKYCAKDREIERLILEDGDLLFNRTNSPELVGKAAVFHEPTEMTFASYLIRARFAPEVVLPDFVNYWINSAWGRAWAHQVKTDGVSQSNINGSKLGAMPLPLPPLAEQEEIVRRASHLLRQADSTLERVELARRSLGRTSQALLAKAFRGELSGAA